MLVPGDDARANSGRVGFAKHVGFSSFCVVVGMGSKERVVGTVEEERRRKRDERKVEEEEKLGSPVTCAQPPCPHLFLHAL